MRKQKSFQVADIPSFKSQLLEWGDQFNEAIWLESNAHEDKYGSFDAILAVDALTAVQTDVTDAFENLNEYQQGTKDWIFGYLTYDLKNTIEDLRSNNEDSLGFPELYFFQPKKIIKIKGDQVDFLYLNMVETDIDEDFNTISQTEHDHSSGSTIKSDIRIKMRIFKDEYFRCVSDMLAHIHRGDIYEANFCQEFYAEDTTISPLRTYQRLNEISEAPFATYLKLNDKYLLSASPERYLRKKGDTIISQPIKGTAQRSMDPKEDQMHKIALSNDQKERAENIMIVDLVRNDLSKSALKGSVRLEELCKVHTYRQVHQLVSTISAKVATNKNPLEILKETFPMGSMTGAPKVSAMQIIEKLEAFKRGLYSGAVGYFTPENDFDFNVIIRSILYNKSKKYVSYAVGSAITAKASPVKEYEECLLKAKAMREVLENT